MKYSNQDIINYYKKDKVNKIIQFDNYEVEVINYMLEKMVYNSKYITEDINPVYVCLKMDCIYDPNNARHYFEEEYAYIDKDLITNFVEKNSELMLIDKKTKFIGEYRWYEEYAIDNPLDYDKKDYSCIVTLSRVGFNNNKAKAMIEFGTQYDPYNGSGEYYILEKKDKNWKIIESIESWES
jgi:hypothetical protein